MLAGMATTSPDSRRRIVETCGEGRWTRGEVAKRFRASEGLAKKLLAQRGRTGDIGGRRRFSGRKARLLPGRGEDLKAPVAKHPDLTLAEVKERPGLACAVPAIHRALARLGLAYKKRPSMRPSRAGPTQPRPGAYGKPAGPRSTPPGSSSSAGPRPRRT